MEAVDIKLKQFLHDKFKERFLKCLWPGNDCNKRAIRAHSIQNKKVIDSISNNGHVIMPNIKIDFKSGPEVHFKLIGKNRATTFTGLCAYHDNYLFKDIDDNEIDLSDERHLFLLAYRSVLKETHTSLKVARDVQTSYLKAIELGKFSPDEINDPMIFATLKLEQARQIFLYKLHYDIIYAEENWSRISHNIICFNCHIPVLAASSVFSCDAYSDVTDGLAYVVFNVFPQDKQLIVIFSFLNEHEIESMKYYIHLKEASEYYLKYEISKLILKKCENFVLSPKVWGNFSSEKQELMLKYFKSTILDPDFDLDDEKLCFFCK